MARWPADQTFPPPTPMRVGGVLAASGLTRLRVQPQAGIRFPPLIYHQLNQQPVPWTHATGKNIAPAIRNPHEAVLRQTAMCVIHAAMTHINMAQPANTVPELSSIIFSCCVRTHCERNADALRTQV